MEGLSMETLKSMMVPLLVIVGLVGIGLAIAISREKVFFSMAMRNLGRRRAQTALTFLGLMLAAMIFSASFATGDTLTHSIRSIGVDAYGETDIRVESKSTEAYGTLGYFDEGYFDEVAGALEGQPRVEGIAPMVGETVPVLATESNLYEPVVTLMGADERYTTFFDPLTDSGGKPLPLDELGANEVYISHALADQLEVSPGKEVLVFFEGQPQSLVVAGVYEKARNPVSTGTDDLTKIDLTVVMPLMRAQSFLQRAGQINAVVITLEGGVVEAVEHSDEVMAVLESDAALEAAGLKADPVKKDNLDAADESGAVFTAIFVVMGSFSIIAGVLLIFLIFVMLAAERKRELGVTRAVGAQRGHVTRLFTYESIPYALVSSAIGSGLGLLFAWGMIQILAPAFDKWGMPLAYRFTAEGMVISYCLGVVTTLLVVFISARRVSHLNIVRAIRDIPEPARPPRASIRGLIVSLLLPVLGLAILLAGLLGEQFASYTLGSSLLVIGLPLLARRFGVPDRAAYTAIGVGLLAFWLTPARYHPLGEESSTGMEMFILSGVMLVAGGVWLVIYNADILLAAMLAVLGRFRALAPVLKTAISYPMAARFRTGMALAMFSLIIFTLALMSAMNASFGKLLDDTDRLGGGFDIFSGVSVVNPIPDIEKAVDERGVGMDNFETIASYSMVPVEMRQVGKGQEWEEVPVAGLDANYLDNTTFGFETTTEFYENKEPPDVWRALEQNPSLAVISAVMTSTEGAAFGPAPDLVIGQGEINLESEVMPNDIYIEVRNPTTGQVHRLQVIAVVDQMAFYAPFVAVSGKALNAMAGVTLPPVSYWFKVAPELAGEVSQLAKELESSFRENGMDATVIKEQIGDITRMHQMFMDLMMVFLGLGLIVGIAALGVIAARSVVERRQQIGMLRAIGFERRMILFSFLLESSFVALLGIGIGMVLGIALTYQIVPEAGVDGLSTVIPWARIALIVGVAYLASLTTTFLPAYQAARLYPAEALRYSE